MKTKPIVFVITPFDEDFLALYDALKEHFAKSYEFINAGDLDNQQSILKDIVVGIYSADVIIADLTGLNPNVFYELGLAHAMNKNVVIITQDIDELPFDIKSYRANQYSLQFNKITQLFSELEKLLVGAINGNILFGNPVSDYVINIPLPSGKDETSVIVDIKNSVNIEPDDDNNENKGFIDFIADIEESMSTMTIEIDYMINDLNKMTSEIEDGTKEINRVNANGGTTATFIRNVSRKLSQPVNIFALQLKNHTSVISDNWSKVENSYLALLDDKRIHTKDNLEGMNESVNSLEQMKIAIYESNEKIKGFMESLNTCMGMERRLTKAMMTLNTELQGYLSITDMIVSSIDRIISKSEIVLSQDKLED